MGRATAATDLRVGFWNTWLLAPRIWPGGPRVPAPDLLSLAPDVPARAPLVGAALAGRFDVVAMSEVFEPSEREAVGRGWRAAELIAGPGRTGVRLTGSGLVTAVDPTRASVTYTCRHVFKAGGDLRDSDTFASKGALLVTLEVGDGLPPVDLVSTHLFAGGDLFPIPGADDQARHHKVRMAQVEELLWFIGDEHDPNHVLLVVGDFNVAVDDPDPSLADPRERYREFADRMTAVGLSDLWASYGVGPGHTCSFSDAGDLPPDPDEPDALVDDPDADPANSPGERIDYLWLRVPDDIQVDVARPRRWAFPGRGPRGGPAGSLSDHLLLSTTLTIHPED